MIRKIILYLILTICAAIFLVPFYFMFMGSFKATSEIFSINFVSLPKHGFKLYNYVDLFRDAQFGRSLANSFIVSTSYILLILLFSSLGGFAFSKYRFPGRNILFIVLLSTIMLPPQITYIPLFILMSKLRWVSTYYALVIPRMLHEFGLPFTIFLMRQYIGFVPNDILDSARTDGCREFRIYAQIVLPMVKPGLLVVGLIVFMASWNDFMWPLIIVNKQDMYTVSLTVARLFGTQREVQWGQVMAACFMSSLPLIIIFVIFRKTFISGITAGALK